MEPKLRWEASLVPKRLQEAPNRLQVGLKRRSRAAKFGPKDVQELAKTLQEAPKRRPRGSQRRQRGSKLGSKDVQEASKSDKTAVQAQFDIKQGHLVKTMFFLRKIEVFVGQERSRRLVWRAK